MTKLVKYFVVRGMLLMMTNEIMYKESDMDVSIPIEQMQELDELFN